MICSNTGVDLSESSQRPTVDASERRTTTVPEAPARPPAPEAISPPIEALRSQEALDHARTTARASWISGQALVGLGRNTEAIEEFRLGLELDPSLATTRELSPKIATLVETARAGLP